MGEGRLNLLSPSQTGGHMKYKMFFFQEPNATATGSYYFEIFLKAFQEFDKEPHGRSGGAFG